MNDKMSFEALNEFLANRKFLLLVGLGFDGRCLTVLENINFTSSSLVIGLTNPKASDHVSLHFHEKFKALVDGNGTLLGIDAASVLDSMDLMQVELRKLHETGLDLVVDITALSHELLVALIGLIQSENLLGKTTLLYTGAKTYSHNTSEDDVWLSRGVADIRSVLGFPGMMLPSKKLHLILLAGFEVERASEVIRRYEPSRLSIGCGGRGESISDDHYKSNSRFVEKLKMFIEEQDTFTGEIHHFEFSCIDPIVAAAQLLNHASKFGDENVVICPLNTKLSTVGAALVGLAREDIQICYAQAVDYNIEGYSSPEDHVRVIPLNEKWPEFLQVMSIL